MPGGVGDLGPVVGRWCADRRERHVVPEVFDRRVDGTFPRGDRIGWRSWVSVVESGLADATWFSRCG